MTDNVTFTVHGLKELHDALMALPAELVSKGGGPVKTALMAATLPVMRTAQNTIPDRDEIKNTGNLAKMIRRRRATKVPKGTEAVQVYIRGNKKAKSDAYYAPWVEFGARGLPPTRWFTKSLESNAKTSTEIFKVKLGAAIDKIATKIGRENLRKVQTK